MVFSALIHDVGHSGVLNAQLVREHSPLAAAYDKKSVLERQSVDLGFALLMDDSFCNLRAAIYSNEDEFRLFRQLVVNAVFATDVMDKDLGSERRDRWQRACSERDGQDGPDATANRKATIVIEHLIQASDVAHTMQHWHVYIKWNERLFVELVRAYELGRTERHPAEDWYEGELGFFDYYVIPLAKKLKDCGVFGVSSDEYLDYAQKNRDEWQDKGRAKVEDYMEKYRQSHVAEFQEAMALERR